MYGQEENKEWTIIIYREIIYCINIHIVPQFTSLTVSSLQRVKSNEDCWENLSPPPRAVKGKII